MTYNNLANSQAGAIREWPELVTIANVVTQAMKACLATSTATL